MHDKDDINSILNAVNEINSKNKKNPTHTRVAQSPISKLNDQLIIPPDVDRLIREAEKYQKKLFSILPNNTNVQSKKNLDQNDDVFILKDEVRENFNSHTKSIEKNEALHILHENEIKLRTKIIDLEHDITLLLAKNSKTDETINYEDFKNNTKENLKSIYKRVEKQKQAFLDLKKNTIKIERNSNVYKENYERLIIENNEFKIRLKIAKEQVVSYETSNSDLSSALDQLNEILSKSKIVGKISSRRSFSEQPDLKKETKIDSTD